MPVAFRTPDAMGIHAGPVLRAECDVQRTADAEPVRPRDRPIGPTAHVTAVFGLETVTLAVMVKLTLLMGRPGDADLTRIRAWEIERRVSGREKVPDVAAVVVAATASKSTTASRLTSMFRRSNSEVVREHHILRRSRTAT